MPGLRNDQVAIYLNDMYKTEYESFRSEPTVYDKVFKMVNARKAPGDKHTQLLGAGNLTRHTVEGQDINFRSPVQGWDALTRYFTYSDGLVLNIFLSWSERIPLFSCFIRLRTS